MGSLCALRLIFRSRFYPHRFWNISVIVLVIVVVIITMVMLVMVVIGEW